MANESVLDSIMILDKCFSEVLKIVNELEDVKYENIVCSATGMRIEVMINQIYKDRSIKNYKSAIRKCIFLKKYLEKEMGLDYES